ncbi:(E3-independent) E2 ubiquitin-conjugating enzyme-like [Acanthaster planci]|uniref:(E3-independent) E2 ubiquitin-conjugating enzyme-like n=1 Tax=Acanthaster planci TaxID=133434 RepID=A0A8B7YM02_ACAPL|nr:(E3-independent) E2 ubiquitin-conjugating enzyme-like [Acanthaster planci]
MASTLFEEDIVQRSHRGTLQLGLVVRNYDGYSSVDDSEDEEERIKKGFVRVAWYPKGRENVLPEKKVSLYDRSLMPGDAVRRDQEGSQRGIVRSVHVSCHLQVVRTKQMIYDVCSQDLENIMMYTPGCHVVMGSWIGVVRNIYVELIVRLKNGARCTLSDDSACRLTDIHDTDDDASVFSCDSFYPGQVLRGPATTFKNTAWLSGQQPILGSKANFTVTVEEVNVVELEVHWQTRGLCRYPAGDCTDSNQLQPPPRRVSKDILPRVRPLSYFIAASIQIGDKVMYKVRPGDLAYPKAVPRGSLDCYVQPSKGEGSGASTAVKGAECGLEALTSQGNANEEPKQRPELAQKDSSEGSVDLKLTTSTGTGCVENPDQCMHGLLTTQADRPEENPSGQCMAGSISGSKGTASAVQESQSAEGGASEDSLGAFAATPGEAQAASFEPKGILRLQDGFASNQSKLDKKAAKGDLDKQKPSESTAEGKDELLARAEELKVGLSRDVDLLGELHRELCDASDSVTDIARNFRTLLQRATNESAREISGQVARLLESQGKLQQQILMTEGLLVDSKKSLKELDEIEMETRGATASGKTAVGKSLRKVRALSAKNRGRRKLDDDRDSDQSSEDREEEEDSSDGLDDSDDTDSNASSKGESRRYKVVSSLLHRHTRKQHKRLASKRRPPPKPLEIGERVCVEVTHTRTLVDVMWQDGTLQKGVVSTDLFPDHQLDELEFFPGDFVTKNNEDLENVYGLVCKTDHKERTCLVQWIMRPNQQCNVPTPVNSEEVSVYELTPHPDFTFNVGDVIVRIADSRHGIAALKKGKPDPRGVHPCTQVGDSDTQRGNGAPHLTRASANTAELGTQTDNHLLGGNQAGTHAIESDTQVGHSDARMGNHITQEGNASSNIDVSGNKSCNSDAQITTPGDQLRPSDTTINNRDVPFCSPDGIQASSKIDSPKEENQHTETTLSHAGVKEPQINSFAPDHIEEGCPVEQVFQTDECGSTRGGTHDSDDAGMANVHRMNLANLENFNAEASKEDSISSSKVENCQATQEAAVPCAGQVRWISTNGEIHVAWVDGSECSVLPQDLYKLEEDSDTDWSDNDAGDDDWKDEDQLVDSSNSTSSSWETASDASDIAEETNVISPPPHQQNASSSPRSPDRDATPSEAGDLEGLPENLDEATFEQTFSALSLVEDKMRRINSCANSILEKRTNSLQLDPDGNAGRDKEVPEGDIKEEVTAVKANSVESEATSESTGTGEPCIPSDTPASSEPGKLGDSSGREIAEAAAPAMSSSAENTVEGEMENRSEDEVGQGEGNSDNQETCQKLPTEGAAPTATGQACDNFFLMEEVPETHHFNMPSVAFSPEDPKQFSLTMRREMRLLQTSLPQGIRVKGFADRMDLFSVLFEGPSNTPYEDGLFFFDAHLPPDYPKSPPVMHYHAYCSGRLNPNLYNDGKVCVSLLGTWTGKGSEMWTSKSNLLQVLVSIQGLILVSEPYYNEAGYEKHRGTQPGKENSRLYNETAVLKMVQSMTLMLTNPPDVFHEETVDFCHNHGFRLIKRIEHWLAISSVSPESGEPGKGHQDMPRTPAFTLLPLSKGFILSMRQALRAYRAALGVAGIPDN